MSSDDLNFSPFMNLNRDVQLAILKQLEFREYRNLALTCRKWYNIASTAPRSMKPVLKFDKIVVNLENFQAEDYPTVINEIGDPIEIIEVFPLSVHKKFGLVKQIESYYIKIDHGFIRDEYDPAVSYLIDNRDKFCFNRLLWIIHHKWPINKQMLSRIFDLPIVDLCIDQPKGSRKTIDLQKLKCIRELIEENKKLVRILCHTSMPFDMFKTVLKQTINGDRPIKVYSQKCTGYLRPNEFRLQNFIHQEFQNVTITEHDYGFRLDYIITTSNSKKIGVSISEHDVSFTVADT